MEDSICVDNQCHRERGGGDRQTDRQKQRQRDSERERENRSDRSTEATKPPARPPAGDYDETRSIINFVTHSLGKPACTTEPINNRRDAFASAYGSFPS